MTQTTIQDHGPMQITEQNVIYWSAHARELQGSMRKKALDLLKHDCIKYLGQEHKSKKKGCFVILPLNRETQVTDYGRTWTKTPFDRDYNSTVYLIDRTITGRFRCTCQAWSTKERRLEGREDGAQCTHVIALMMAFKLRRFNKNAPSQLQEPDAYQHAILR